MEQMIHHQNMIVQYEVRTWLSGPGERSIEPFLELSIKIQILLQLE